MFRVKIQRMRNCGHLSRRRTRDRFVSTKTAANYMTQILSGRSLHPAAHENVKGDTFNDNSTR